MIVLLLANVVLFLYARNENTPPPPPQQPLLNDERVTLLKSLAEGEPVPVAPAPAPEPVITCLEWGPLAEAQLDNARTALNRIPNIGPFQETRRQGSPRSWLVSIDNISSRAAAVNRANELRRQGVSDISVLEPGPEAGATFALSLGVFSSEQGAQSRAASLTNKKISGVKVMPRGAATSVFFVVSNASPELEQRLRELPPRFADSAVQSTACPSPH
ncbi:MAG: hypothetical protein LBB65_00980 [Burkholderiales bacterium]|nr:hypothetical protein [Burkholderiales bacterium]